MKFHSAANGLATEAFQKCNWGQIDPMVDRGLISLISIVSLAERLLLSKTVLKHNHILKGV